MAQPAYHFGAEAFAGCDTGEAAALVPAGFRHVASIFL
jgi:hypothetical protein